MRYAVYDCNDEYIRGDYATEADAKGSLTADEWENGSYVDLDLEGCDDD